MQSATSERLAWCLLRVERVPWVVFETLGWKGYMNMLGIALRCRLRELRHRGGYLRAVMGQVLLPVDRTVPSLAVEEGVLIS